MTRLDFKEINAKEGKYIPVEIRLRMPNCCLLCNSMRHVIGHPDNHSLVFCNRHNFWVPDYTICDDFNI